MFRITFSALTLLALAATTAAHVSNKVSEPALDHVSEHQEVSVNFNVDVLGIGEAIAGAISSSENREGFVKNLRNTAYYAADGQYNVMVFNLSVDHDEAFSGVQLYGSAYYGDVVYGIWVFESGSFRNNGDGGYINWAFRGQFERDGGYVSFS